MTTTSSTRTAARSPLNTVIAVAILAAAILTLLGPGLDVIRQQNDLTTARQQLVELDILHPLYRDIIQAQAELDVSSLELPPRVPLPQSAILDIPEHIHDLAGTSNITVDQVNPRVGSADGKRHLDVEVLAMGSYDDLRDFLLALLDEPALDRIDRIDVSRDQGRESISLNLRLAIEKP